MSSGNYYPAKDADFVTWYTNFQQKLVVYGPTLGTTAADLLMVENDLSAIAYMVTQVMASKKDGQDRVKFKHLLLRGRASTTPVPYPGAFNPGNAPDTDVPFGVTARLRSLVKRLKSSTAYTPNIGMALGIEKNPVPTPPSIKPTGSVLALPGAEVEIKFIKRGFSGVQVESKRGAETAWAVLGAYVRSPLLDTRELLVAGQPEQRSYRMRFLDGNEPVGTVSSTLTTTTQM